MTEATPETKKPTALASEARSREDAESFTAREPARERIDESLVQSTDQNHPSNAKKKTPDSSYQSYLFGKGGTSDVPAWSDSRLGRLGIRGFSRGFTGATFFVIGGLVAERQLKGYFYDYKNGAHEINWRKPLQVVAYGIDRLLGGPVKQTVKFIAENGGSNLAGEEAAIRAVTFRGGHRIYNTAIALEDGIRVAQPAAVMGRPDLHRVVAPTRSYGEEAVKFTFDFAAASTGDALTRNLIGVVDPDVKKSWLVNDEGKPAGRGERKHILWGELAKSIGKSGWVIFSKNQGEDWAAAIPYAFQMKFQRTLLNNVYGGAWRGHEYAFDKGLNGGIQRISRLPTGSNHFAISGDSQVAGALDLHLRFTGYNWYTLMYREGWDWVGNTFNHWKDNHYKVDLHLPEHFNPITSAVDGVGKTMRYLTKSFIKANLYMNPAVIPFWAIRTPQSKWKGSEFIEQLPNNEYAVHNQAYVNLNGTNTPYKPYNHWNPAKESNYNYTPRTFMGKVEKRFSQMLHPVGYFSHWSGTQAAKLGEHILPNGGWFGNLIREGGGKERFMRSYIDAAYSYTPYMYAKQELGLLVDDNKGDGKAGLMDLAIYRFMDNVASGNMHGIKESLKEMWKLGTNFERDVTVREGETNLAQGATKPQTTVSANTVNHDPVNLSRGEAGNDANMKGPNAANEAQADPNASDKRWAQAVVGGDYHAARFQPGGASRH